MSWLAKLYETYDCIDALEKHNSGSQLWPISHFVKNAHFEVSVDFEGNFLKGQAKILHGDESPTLIAATEASAGRSGSKIAPHPLSEEIGYCAADRPGADQNKVSAYLAQLKDWKNSKYSHPKVEAVLRYLTKGTLWKDISSEVEFPLKRIKSDGKNEKINAEKVFIRWRIARPGELDTTTWNDKELIEAWICFDRERNNKEGYCHIQGVNNRRASNHPRFLRWPGDGAKLISSNDHSGFTFRGRFSDSKASIDKSGTQPACIGFEVSQKAHNALRWLLANQQCFRNNEQVLISWAVSCKKTPDLFKDSFNLFQQDAIWQEEAESIEDIQEKGVDHTIDLGGSFAVKLRKYIAGYRANLDVNEQIIVMGLDSATPGRMGIIYYRELLASEFLDLLEKWHCQFAWPQRHTIEIPDPMGKKKPFRKTIWPVSSPAPKLIIEAAYGDIIKSNESLKKSVIERILPCIVDGRPFPQDIVLSAVRRASNRNNCEFWEWQRNLGVACALYRGFYQRYPHETREYKMTLEEDRTTRDYLYGRLLAIGERIEETALRVAGEDRPTTAARLMQRFADRPFSTWRNLELALQPYMQRLQANRAGFLVNRKKELDRILASFSTDTFSSDKALSGEFLLGYHCQRQAWKKQDMDENFDENKGEEL